jgi:hypothetical protein
LLAGLLAWVATVAIDLWVMTPFWGPTALDPDEVQLAYYEPAPSGVVVTTDHTLETSTLPGVSLRPDGAVNVTWGMVVAVRLDEGLSYALRSTLEDLSPHVMIGTMSGRPDGASADEPQRHSTCHGPVGRISGLQTFRANGSALDTFDADPSTPWGPDRARLAEIRASCGDGTLTLRRGPDGIHVGAGRCEPATIPATHEPLYAVVSAGPHPATIARSTPWSARREVSSAGAIFACLLAAVHGALVVLGLGLEAALGAMAVIAILGVVSPVRAFDGIALFTLASFLFAGGRAARRWHWSLAPLTVALLGGLGLGFHRWFLDVTGRGGNEDPEGGAAPACVVVGYSTAAQEALRCKKNGLFDRLQHGCAPCSGKTALRARAGQTLPRLVDPVCALPPASSPGELVFIGGNNDDFIGWIEARSFGAMVRNIRSAVELRYEPWRDVARESAGSSTGSLAWLPAQTAAIGAIAACARERGYALRFIHDMAAPDLDSGRSPERQQMLAARRAAVEAQGGEFVAIEEAYRSEIGVAWFADFIHLSAVGHARVAGWACRSPSRPSPGDP